jgi:hypothetical protein
LSTDVSEVCAASIIRAMMNAARTSETSVDNYFTRQYIPEDKSELQSNEVLGKQLNAVKPHQFKIQGTK